MKEFTLLINGEDLNTGIYEYYPYSHKYISDFRNVFKLLTKLKIGKISESEKIVEEYIFAKYCVGREDTNSLAIDSAYKAFKNFRYFPLAKRKKILLDMYALLLEKKKEFINLLIIEGHPLKLAEWEFEGMRIGSSPETINFYSKHMQKEVGRYGKEFLYWVRRPDGVICVSPPKNAAASNSYNAILAFLSGNTLIMKPPLKQPLSTIFLWKEVVNKALLDNSAPKGALNIVLGNSRIIMDEWLNSPYVRDIFYFGDSERGFDIGSKIFQAGKKPILEMSGNDLFILWKDGDLEGASDSLLDCFLGSTQICMVPKIALVHHKVYKQFIDKFIAKVKKIKISLPNDPETILSPVGRIQDFSAFLEDALVKGARLLYGSDRVNHRGEADSKGMYLRPAVLVIDEYKKALDMKCVKEEIFFPMLPIIIFSGSDEEVFYNIVSFVDNHSYGLRLSLWCSSSRYLRKFIKKLDNSGLLRVNSRHVGFSYYLSTHGGVRKSGGPFGEMNYFWHRTSHLQGICKVKSK